MGGIKCKTKIKTETVTTVVTQQMDNVTYRLNWPLAQSLGRFSEILRP